MDWKEFVSLWSKPNLRERRLSFQGWQGLCIFSIVKFPFVQQNNFVMWLLPRYLCASRPQAGKFFQTIYLSRKAEGNGPMKPWQPPRFTPDILSEAKERCQFHPQWCWGQISQINSSEIFFNIFNSSSDLPAGKSDGLFCLAHRYHLLFLLP